MMENKLWWPYLQPALGFVLFTMFVMVSWVEPSLPWSYIFIGVGFVVGTIMAVLGYRDREWIQNLLKAKDDRDRYLDILHSIAGLLPASLRVGGGERPLSQKDLNLLYDRLRHMIAILEEFELDLNDLNTIESQWQAREAQLNLNRRRLEALRRINAQFAEITQMNLDDPDPTRVIQAIREFEDQAAAGDYTLDAINATFPEALRVDLEAQGGLEKLALHVRELWMYLEQFASYASQPPRRHDFREDPYFLVSLPGDEEDRKERPWVYAMAQMYRDIGKMYLREQDVFNHLLALKNGFTGRQCSSCHGWSVKETEDHVHPVCERCKIEVTDPFDDSNL